MYFPFRKLYPLILGILVGFFPYSLISVIQGEFKSVLASNENDLKDQKDSSVIFSVVIVTYNQPVKLNLLLHSIKSQTHCPPFEVLVVDNGCMKDTEYIVNRHIEEINFKGVTKDYNHDNTSKKVMKSAKRGDENENESPGSVNNTYSNIPFSIRYIPLCENIGYSKANNIGAKLASKHSQWLLFLNDDLELYSYFFHFLVAKTLSYYSETLSSSTGTSSLFNEELKKNDKGNHFNLQPSIYDNQRTSIGAVGAKLLQPYTKTDDIKISEAGNIIWRDGTGHCYGRDILSFNSNHTTFLRPVDYVSGAALLVNKNAFDEYNGFQGDIFSAYYEDTDLCFYLRYQKGLQVLYQPLAIAIHKEHSSFTTESSEFLLEKSRYKFLSRWERFIDRWKTKNTFDPKMIFLSRANNFNMYKMQERAVLTTKQQKKNDLSVLSSEFLDASMISSNLPITMVLLVSLEKPNIIHNNGKDERKGQYLYAQEADYLAMVLCYLKEIFIFHFTVILPEEIMIRENLVNNWRQSGIEVLTMKEGIPFIKQNFFSLLLSIEFQGQVKSASKSNIQGEQTSIVNLESLHKSSVILTVDSEIGNGYLSLEISRAKFLRRIFNSINNPILSDELPILKKEIISKMSMIDLTAYLVSTPSEDSEDFQSANRQWKDKKNHAKDIRNRNQIVEPYLSNFFKEQCQLLSGREGSRDVIGKGSADSNEVSFNYDIERLFSGEKVSVLTFLINLDLASILRRESRITNDFDDFAIRAWLKSYMSELVSIVQWIIEGDLKMKTHFNLGNERWPLFSPLLITNAPQIVNLESCSKLKDSKWPIIDFNNLLEISNDNMELNTKRKILESLSVNPFLEIPSLQHQERLDLLLLQKQKNGLALVDFIFVSDDREEINMATFIEENGQHKYFETLMDEEIKKRYNVIFENADINLNFHTIRVPLSVSSENDDKVFLSSEPSVAKKGYFNKKKLIDEINRELNVAVVEKR